MGKKKIELDANTYNHKDKLLFLNSIKNDSSKDAYKSMLLQMAKYEKEIDKDFYDMSPVEARNCIDTLTRTTLNASNTLLSKISNYLFWANANNFTENVELLGWIKTLKGEDIVSKTAMENQYVTKDDLEKNIIQKSRNAQNKALVILLFRGVEGIEMSELRLLKKTDIDFENNTIHLTGYVIKRGKNKYYNRDVELNPDEMSVLKEAMEQTSYYEINPKKEKGKKKLGQEEKESKKWSLLRDSEYLFKNTEYARKSIDGTQDIVKRSELIKRLREIAQEARIPLTSGNIIMSGELYEVTQLRKPFEEITEDDYIGILKKYNKQINNSSIILLRDLYKYLLKNEIKVAVTQ